MLLERKVAVIYGAGGAIGGAVARAFAREGARLFLTGRSLASIVGVAAKIGAAGGVAEAAQVDARDERAIESHLDAVVRKTERPTPFPSPPRCSAPSPSRPTVSSDRTTTTCRRSPGPR